MESININNLFGKKFNNDTNIDIRRNFSVSNITTSNIIKNMLNDDDIIEKINKNNQKTAYYILYDGFKGSLGCLNEGLCELEKEEL